MKRRTFLFALTAAAVLPARAQMRPMKIGVVGSGRIGSTLGGLWVKAGHEVMFSDRDPEQAKRVAAELGARARSGTPRDAVAFADAVLIAVPYGALPAVKQEIGEQLKGKVVIDPNNPVPSRDGELGAQAKEKGAAVSTAAMLPGARLVRSFNYCVCLLAAYYILRPLRDEMGVAGGVRNLQWLFTATFVTMLAAVPCYGFLVARLPRRRFIPFVYHFFVANLAIFWALLALGVDKQLVA